MHYQEGLGLHRLLPNVIISKECTSSVRLLAVRSPAVIFLTMTEAFPVEARTSHCCKIPIDFHPVSQLRTAEDRIAELEAEVQQYRERAERAENWLHKISAEIEDRLINQPEGKRRHASPR